MWRFGLLWCLLAGAALAFDRTRSDVTPVQKVIELLKKLSLKVQEEGKREAAAYDKYACFCKEQTDSKVHVLEKSKLLIEELTAAVDALGGEISQLDSDVITAKGTITTEKGEANATQTVRDTTFGTYQTARANLTEGIDAIERAMQALRESKDDVKEAQAASLLAEKALSYARLSSKASQEPKKYKYQSNDILATLQDLLRTFKQELTRVDEEEAADRNKHQMVEGARANKITALQAEVDKKQQLSAQKAEEKAEKEGLKADEEAAAKADQEFLDELTAGCQDKADAWDKRSKTRASEITAIQEAAGVLEGMGDLYSVNKKLAGLQKASHSGKLATVQPHAPVLLQVQRDQPAQSPIRPVAKLLTEKASALKSPALAALAEKLSSKQSPTDHFVEVRALINDLITKLEAEAAEEATQKTFCDKEMTAAIDKRDQNRADMETHQASIDKTKSEIVTLEEDIATLGVEIADLYKAKKELTDLRDKEKASNALTVTDADAGAEAVKKAITVLKNFYGSALLQRKALYTPPNADRDGNTVGDLAPEEPFSGEYDGAKAESKGVLGLLEVIASDFERTSSTTAAAETKAQTDFETEIGTMDSEIEQKEKDQSTYETDVGTKKTDLVGFEDSLKDSTALHKDAIEQLEALKSQCVDASESYEERAANRKKEIAALKEALEILENWKG